MIHFSAINKNHHFLAQNRPTIPKTSLGSKPSHGLVPVTCFLNLPSFWFSWWHLFIQPWLHSRFQWRQNISQMSLPFNKNINYCITKEHEWRNCVANFNELFSGGSCHLRWITISDMQCQSKIFALLDEQTCTETISDNPIYGYFQLQLCLDHKDVFFSRRVEAV